MNLKEILSYPYENWLRPVALMLVSMPIFVVSEYCGIGLLQLIGGGLFFISIFLVVTSLLFLLFKKQWQKAWYTLLFVFAMVIAFGLLAG